MSRLWVYQTGELLLTQGRMYLYCFLILLPNTGYQSRLEKNLLIITKDWPLIINLDKWTKLETYYLTFYLDNYDSVLSDSFTFGQILNEVIDVLDRSKVTANILRQQSDDLVMC